MAPPEALQVKPRKRRVGKVGGDSVGSPPTVFPSMRAEEASDLAGLLHALADPTRLQMVSLLAEHPGEVCVCDITRSFDLDQSTISHHLRLLREASLTLEARLTGVELSVRNLLQLKEGHLLTFDRSIGSPIERLVNGRQQYRGQVVSTGKKRALLVEQVRARAVQGSTSGELALPAEIRASG